MQRAAAALIVFAMLLPAVAASASDGPRCRMSSAPRACHCPTKSFPCASVTGRHCCEVESNDLPQLPTAQHEQLRIDPPQMWSALPPAVGPSAVLSLVAAAAPRFARGPPGERDIWLLVNSLLL